MSHLVFVYGTLMNSYLTEYVRRNNHHSQLSTIAELFDLALFLGEAQTSGNLYKVTHFPGLVAHLHESRVFGELYQLDENLFKRLMPLLDEYEECDEKSPRPHLYRRERIIVVCNGKRLSAWTYLYNLSPQGLTPISSGRFTPEPT